MSTRAGSTVPDHPEKWRRLALATGATGLIAIMIQFTAIIAVGSVGEPPLQATSADATTFFRATEAAWAQAAQAATSLGMVVFLWLVVGFALMLRRAEGDPPWRSGVALASGVLVTAYGVLDASWDAASHRGADLDPTLAGYAYDVGNIGFANTWLAMASFALACGSVVLSTRFLPTWTGWCAVTSGTGLLIVRFLWTVDGLWLLPYGLLWLWILATCVHLIRRRTTVANHA